MTTSQNTQQEIFRFIATGLTAVATDFGSYLFMLDIVSADIAKGSSFILGSVVAYFMNKIWTFGNNEAVMSTLVHFILLYSLTFMANVAVNHISLIYISELMVIGFILATATSTILNFIGMKFWVFSKKQ